eukprot:TRINITY_DN15046_c0_g1_i1.p1 TRINITY_DN15046_c0_g1~~TRINITY_DN15046_c0_g1_i1.p1  ORF type:complete len:567 (-),score=108.88 TRINITY_DN15046_c0_g1_i1:8-1480(-)
MQMVEPLREYILSNRAFFGICIGMQTLFESSDEAPGVKGLGIIPGRVVKFPTSVGEHKLAVPHMGWNGVNPHRTSDFFADVPGGDISQHKLYFVHSFHAVMTAATRSWCLATTDYGPVSFLSAVQRGSVVATQFHPEKSGGVGLALLRSFLARDHLTCSEAPVPVPLPPTVFSKRIVAGLDVRTNDDGDLVVTKGDQYDVREKGAGHVRNLGKPVELAARYFAEGADEICFLNITSFRNSPLADLPMLKVLELASERIFVPLTIGGGIRDYTDETGTKYTALDVAAKYFRSGADKVSIGSDAVTAAQEYLGRGGVASGTSPIEQISKAYGAQAVVVSIDPKRVYVATPSDTPHHTFATARKGPNGEGFCWMQCTIKGGRETADLDAVKLAQVAEQLGAGEILLNSIDMDGTNQGYDCEFIAEVKRVVSIPVIASSGAGSAEHFERVFKSTQVEAALAAGIFHRREVEIADIKEHLRRAGVPVRIVAPIVV